MSVKRIKISVQLEGSKNASGFEWVIDERDMELSANLTLLDTLLEKNLSRFKNKLIMMAMDLTREEINHNPGKGEGDAS